MTNRERPSLSSLSPELRDELRHVRGRGVTRRRVQSEAEHFCVCEKCGQAVDMRSLYQVLYHEDEQHEPLSESVLSETSPIQLDRKPGRKRPKRAAKGSKVQEKKADF